MSQGDVPFLLFLKNEINIQAAVLYEILLRWLNIQLIKNQKAKLVAFGLFKQHV